MKLLLSRAHHTAMAYAPLLSHAHHTAMVYIPLLSHAHHTAMVYTPLLSHAHHTAMVYIPHNHAPVYGVTSFKATVMGCMCNSNLRTCAFGRMTGIFHMLLW